MESHLHILEHVLKKPLENLMDRWGKWVFAVRCISAVCYRLPPWLSRLWTHPYYTILLVLQQVTTTLGFEPSRPIKAADEARSDRARQR